MTSARHPPASFIPQYNALIAAQDYEAAHTLFRDALDVPTLQGIGELSYQRIPLLEALFPQGIDHRPALRDPHKQLKVLYDLGLAYIGGAGSPKKARIIYPQYIALAEQLGDESLLAVGLGDYSKALRQTGDIRRGEEVARRGLLIQRNTKHPRREAVNLYRYGTCLAQRGIQDESARMLAQAASLFKAEAADKDHALVESLLAQSTLWIGDADTALTHARRTWDISDKLATDSSQLDLNGIFKVRTAASRIIGEALMLKQELDEAETWVTTGLSTANLIHMVEESLPLLQVQTEIARQRGQFELAHHSLQATWEMAQAGGYVTFDADSNVMLARIYVDTGEREKAITAAQTAYRIAWCDGPPFAYQRGVDDARMILEGLNAAIPELPPFDEAAWPPLLEVTFEDADSL